MIKNTTNLERIFRILVGLALAVYAATQLAFPLSLCVAAVGVILALTGMSGYCPMCHVAGREEIK